MQKLESLPLRSERDPRNTTHGAKATSALNHANICTIHEIDEVNGQTFITMDFLDGMTLKHRINGKPMETVVLLPVVFECPGVDRFGQH